MFVAETIPAAAVVDATGLCFLGKRPVVALEVMISRKNRGAASVRLTALDHSNLQDEFRVMRQKPKEARHRE